MSRPLLLNPVSTIPGEHQCDRFDGWARVCLNGVSIGAIIEINICIA